MNKFVENLKELIDETGLSLRQLQTKSGVNAIQYSRYLRGYTPTLDVTLKIAKYFNCSLDFLFGLSDEKNNQHYEGYSYDINKFLDRYLLLLKQNKITNYKFARSSIFNESTIRHWKNGKVPRLDVVYNIARDLDSSMDYLIGRK